MSNTDELDEILEPIFKLGYDHSEKDYDEAKQAMIDRERKEAYKKGYIQCGLDGLDEFNKAEVLKQAHEIQAKAVKDINKATNKLKIIKIHDQAQESLGSLHYPEDENIWLIINDLRKSIADAEVERRHYLVKKGILKIERV